MQPASNIAARKMGCNISNAARVLDQWNYYKQTVYRRFPHRLEYSCRRQEWALRGRTISTTRTHRLANNTIRCSTKYAIKWFNCTFDELIWHCECSISSWLEYQRSDLILSTWIQENSYINLWYEARVTYPCWLTLQYWNDTSDNLGKTLQLSMKWWNLPVRFTQFPLRKDR